MRASFVFMAIALFLPFKLSLFLVAVYLFFKFNYFSPKGINPFEEDDRKPRRPYELDQRKRDQVIKQGFSPSKVPDNLDAVVIGSGLGGLGTAAILSKAGKKVLVLEQHDQAGGCCHSYIDKGYEFDAGIHYVGKFEEGCFNRTIMDQLTEGQVEWVPLNSTYDVVTIGYGDDRKDYPVVKGIEDFRSVLKKTFPSEHDAIDKYFELVNTVGKQDWMMGLLKLLPLRACKLLIRTGLIHAVTKLWRGPFRKSTLEIVSEMTKDPHLRTVFCYCWGDYGVPPDRSHFLIQASLMLHFLKKGAFYPKGGSSEIAYNTIPVIERSGGRVLVRANVVEILMENGRAAGVRVRKAAAGDGDDEGDGKSHAIRAPLVISSAGVFNTFQRLLPAHVAEGSYFKKLADSQRPGLAAMTVFVGLDATAEELGLTTTNTWAFNRAEDALTGSYDYLKLSPEKAMEARVPLLFVSFPSTKDPNWDLHPGRKDKSTCIIITMASWEWFSRFDGTKLKKRGDDYDELKGAIGNAMLEQACQLYPQIRHHVDFLEVGSPLTNKHYLAQPHGEIYGLDHHMGRFDPLMVSQLRPETDVPGLFLTGQDVMTAGITGALMSGVLSAGAVLNRNLIGDLKTLHETLYPG